MSKFAYGNKNPRENKNRSFNNSRSSQNRSRRSFSERSSSRAGGELTRSSRPEGFLSPSSTSNQKSFNRNFNQTSSNRNFSNTDKFVEKTFGGSRFGSEAPRKNGFSTRTTSFQRSEGRFNKNFQNNSFNKSFGENTKVSSYNRRDNNSNRNNRGGRGNGRRKIEGYKFTEDMFIKKATVTNEEIKYTSTFKFHELDVHPTLKQNIVTKKFETPTPIQDKSIKHIIDGKDILGIADTGTGKTAAFLIPLIDKIVKNRASRVLVITPTRELAEQINDELYVLTKDLRIFSVECIGGSNIRSQIYNLQRGYNFVIGTPGRLKDLFDRNILKLEGFDTVVLDEVDRMLDMGFVNEIKHLISFLPEDRQSLFFSATVDRKVEEIINVILKEDHVKVSVKTGETAQNVEQNIVRINRHDEKIPKLEELLNSEGFEKVLVFVNTKREVDHLDKHLYDKGFKVESIHGERRQNERKRSIESFKNGRANILVATDVAARGLDINNVTHVINYDIPMTYEDYIHRVGRTGRANKKGLALTFVESSSARY